MKSQEPGAVANALEQWFDAKSPCHARIFPYFSGKYILCYAFGMGFMSEVRKAWKRGTDIVEGNKAGARRVAAELPPLSLLTDASTRIVLAYSRNTGVIATLADCTLDSYYVPNFNYPNYRTQKPPAAKGGSLAHWTWNTGARKFVPTRDDVATPEMHARSRLVNAKLRTLSQMMRFISATRSRIASTIVLQETVYMTKKLQAKEFKETGYDEARLIEFPYVLHYADLLGIPAQEAADDILLKSKLADDVLAKSEAMRLAYFDRVKKAHSPEELPRIVEDFHREAVLNAII